MDAPDARELDLAALRCYRDALGMQLGTLRTLGADDAAALVLARWLRVCDRLSALEAVRP